MLGVLLENVLCIPIVLVFMLEITYCPKKISGNELRRQTTQLHYLVRLCPRATKAYAVC